MDFFLLLLLLLFCRRRSTSNRTTTTTTMTTTTTQQQSHGTRDGTLPFPPCPPSRRARKHRQHGRPPIQSERMPQGTMGRYTRGRKEEWQTPSPFPRLLWHCSVSMRGSRPWLLTISPPLHHRHHDPPLLPPSPVFRFLFLLLLRERWTRVGASIVPTGRRLLSCTSSRCTHDIFLPHNSRRAHCAVRHCIGPP